MPNEEPDDAPSPLQKTVMEALARKAPDFDAPCEVCGTNLWRVNSGSIFFRLVTPGGRLAGTGGTQDGFEVAAVWCDHCGFLRLHALPPLAAD